jgi:hypothetical protein
MYEELIPDPIFSIKYNHSKHPILWSLIFFLLLLLPVLVVFISIISDTNSANPNSGLNFLYFALILSSIYTIPIFISLSWKRYRVIIYKNGIQFPGYFPGILPLRTIQKSEIEYIMRERSYLSISIKNIKEKRTNRIPIAGLTKDELDKLMRSLEEIGIKVIKNEWIKWWTIEPTNEQRAINRLKQIGKRNGNS